MKVIDGVRYYNSREVAEIVGRSRQTVVNWDKYSEELDERGEKRLIPKPIRIGKNRNRHWTKAQIEEIKHFRDNIKQGDMAEFNRRLWGKRTR